ncbi:MAG: DUF5103 domain-containing protein [Bacteroidales bacterium]
MRNFLLILLLHILCIHADASAGWRTASHDPNIKSVRVICNDRFDVPPLIELRSGQQIEVSFDELSSDMSRISYRIIHCDADWKPSRISELEYLDGFNQLAVEDAQPSFNTFVPYYHYRIRLPNDQIQFNISGNYAVLFYKDEDPETIIASACISVFERQTEVQGYITSNTDISFNGEYQQVGIRLKWKNAFLSNPADELKVVVCQNNRLDNQVVVNHPTRFSANEAVYEHNRNLIFEAGNNYRRFEIVNHQYAAIGVEQIRYFEPMYHVLLSGSQPRASLPYYYDRDQNGRYIIRNSDAQDNDTEADYFMIHFALEDENPFIQGSIYLNGDLTYGLFNDDSKMIYNFESHRYEKALLLKQGHYNYQYLFVEHGSDKGSTKKMEGNFHETQNEYLVRIYHRPPGQRYDRLIGFSLIQN